MKQPWFFNSNLVPGLLPSVMLAVLMALLPIILRLMAKLAGLPTLGAVELRTQNSYFAFQVIQVFLVTTVASSASAVGAQIAKDPSSATTLLAEDLPKSANFYISFFIVQGLTISSGALLQIVGLILSRVLSKLFDSTPRKMYNRFATLSGLGWGTVFPVWTNLAVVAITYSLIAPLMLGFATVGLYLIYVATRYNVIFTSTSTIDTQGAVYPRALQQTTTGCYLAIVCMIGLFGIKTAIGPLVLMVIFLVFCILFHLSLNSAIADPIKYLPKSLEAEEEALLSVEDGVTNEKPISTAGSKSTDGKNGSSGAVTEKGLPPAPYKKPNFLVKWLLPTKYCDYQTLRRLVPRNFGDVSSYDPETERNAYYNPAVASPTPLLWIPRDSMGISRQEVRHTSRIIPITDDGASLDEKNKIVWNNEDNPPIYQGMFHPSFSLAFILNLSAEKIYY